MNRKLGKVIQERRCNTRGKYKKGEESISWLMTILGDKREDKAFLSHRCFTEGTTNLFRFLGILLELFDLLDANRLRRSFLLMMDNLNIHCYLLILILNFTTGCGHQAVFSALYWSCDGSIEYVFNTIQTWFQMDVHGVENVLELVGKIGGIVSDMSSFKNYLVNDMHNDV